MTNHDDDFVQRFREKLAGQHDESAPASAMKRWRAALDVAARPTPVQGLDWGLRFAAAGSIVLALAGVVFLAYRDDAAMNIAASPLESVRVDRKLQLHLVDLETQLARAGDLPLVERGSTLRQLAQQNRLQTAVAERAGGSREARLLRAFTVALEDMAADSDVNGRFRASLAQLVFELNVTQARLASSSPSIDALRSQAL
jgi:hypothetical protein